MRFVDLIGWGRKMLIRFDEVWWFLVRLGYILGWGWEMLSEVWEKSGMVGRVWDKLERMDENPHEMFVEVKLNKVG